MTEAQLKSFSAFRDLPIYEESDERANSITTVHGGTYSNIRECTTLQQVEECLNDARYVPLGGLRATTPGGHIAIAYFGDTT